MRPLAASARLNSTSFGEVILQRYPYRAIDGDGTRSGTNAAPSQERLQHIRETLDSLKSDRRILMDSIRESLDELRSLRESLRISGLAGGTGSGSSLREHLQQQYRLTPREGEVAVLLAEGASNSGIASLLGISPHTARHHTQAVLSKLGARSRSEAGAKVRR